MIAAVAVVGFSGYTSKTTSTNELVVEPRDDSYDKQENIPSNLPMLNGPFVGREKEVNEIVRYLKSESVHIVSIYGPPAFGKSTLAIHVGYKMIASGIPVRYIDMTESMFALFGRSARNLMDLPTQNLALQNHNLTQVGAKLDEHKFPSYADWAELLNWAKLIKTHTVLLLDNCDQILHERREEFHNVIQQLQHFSHNKMKVIITSQEQIKVLEKSYSASVSELSLNASVKLLQELAHIYGVYQITTAEGNKLASLVGNCPLALKVISMLLRQHSYNASVLARMLKRALISTISDRGLPQQHRFTALMDLAYKFLDESTCICSHYLGFFPGSFDSEAAIHILELSGIPSGSECLDILLWRSLIERYVHGHEIRFKIHKLIKTYFIEKLALTSQTTLELFRFLFNSSFRKYYSKYVTTFAQHIQKTEGASSDAEIYKFKSEAHNVKFLLQMLLDNQLTSEFEAATLAFACYERMLPEDHTIYKKMFHTLYSRETFDFICEILGRNSCASVYVNVLHKLYLSICKNQSCNVFSCDYLHNILHQIERIKNSIGNSSEAAGVMRLIKLNYATCEPYISHHVVITTVIIFFVVTLVFFNLCTCLFGQGFEDSMSVCFADGLTFFFFVFYHTSANLEYFLVITLLTLTLLILIYKPNNEMFTTLLYFFTLFMNLTISSVSIWITPLLMFLVTVSFVVRRTKNLFYITSCFLLCCSFTVLWFSGNNSVECYVSLIIFFGILTTRWYGSGILNEPERLLSKVSLVSLSWSYLGYFKFWFIMYVDVNIYVTFYLVLIFGVL